MTIYFARGERSREIKIGYCDGGCCAHRLAEHARSRHERVRFLGTMPGLPEDERALHLRFDRLRIPFLAALGRRKTEWFKPGRDLVRFIREHANPTVTRRITRSKHITFRAPSSDRGAR